MNAFSAAMSVPWAIRPETLRVILEIANREGEGPEALAAKLGRPLENTYAVEMRGGVAIIPVTGPIFRRANLFTQMSGAVSLEMLTRDFAVALEDPAVNAIILSFDSPGGEANGVNEFAAMVHAARGKKPVRAYVSNLAASAAYWIASATDEIVMDAAAMVGSIGVVAAVPDPSVSRSRDLEFVSSQSPKKRPNPTTEAGQAQIQNLVDSLADVFVASVARNRGVSTEKVLRDFGAGDLLVGQLAVDAGMADRLGSFEQVLAELTQRTDEYGRWRSPVAAGSTPMSFRDKVMAWLGAGAPPDFDEDTVEAAAPAVIPGNPVAELEGQMAEIIALAQPDASAERLSALETELQASRATIEQQAAAISAAGERIVAMERASKRAEYAALAKSEGFMFGTPEEHADTLLEMGEKLGPEAVTKAIEREKAIAAGYKTSALLTEIGKSGAGPVGDSARDELDRKAKEIVAKSESKISYSDAVDKALATDATLSARVAREGR